MKRTSLFIIFILFCGAAIACDSYEECLNTSVLSERPAAAYYVAGQHKGYTQDNKEDFLLRAIAYKLDEISKKLDKDNVRHGGQLEAPGPEYVKQKCADGCIRWFDPVHKVFWKDGAAGTAIECDGSIEKLLGLNK